LKGRDNLKEKSYGRVQIAIGEDASLEKKKELLAGEGPGQSRKTGHRPGRFRSGTERRNPTRRMYIHGRVWERGLRDRKEKTGKEA